MALSMGTGKMAEATALYSGFQMRSNHIQYPSTLIVKCSLEFETQVGSFSVCSNCVLEELTEWNGRSFEDEDFLDWAYSFGPMLAPQYLPRPPITDQIRFAAELLREWNSSRLGDDMNGGPLHSLIDDANLDEEVIDSYLGVNGDAPPVPKWGFEGYQLTKQERRLYRSVLEALKSLTLIERYLAWGLYNGCITETVTIPKTALSETSEGLDSTQ